MADKLPGDIMFSATVKAVQDAKGSRGAYAKMEAKGAFRNFVTPDLAGFLEERDSFYFATADAEGQPYIQHRGGEPGFLKVVDERTLGFADFKGNRQYISVGNLAENPKAYIFLMDYANRRRVKIWGEARIVEDDPALLSMLSEQTGAGTVERAILFKITAWDVNCPQHITPRYTADQVAALTRELTDRIVKLEAELAGVSS